MVALRTCRHEQVMDGEAGHSARRATNRVFVMGDERSTSKPTPDGEEEDAKMLPKKKAGSSPSVNSAAVLSRWKDCLCLKPDSDEQEEKKKNTSPAAKWRWAMLAILSIDICVSYIPYYTFVPIPRQSMQVYNVDEAALNVLCILYALVFVPAALVTGPIVSFLGCRWTFVAAMASTSIGCFLRAWPSLRLDLALYWSIWRGMPESASVSFSTTTPWPDPGGSMLLQGSVHAAGAGGAVDNFWWLVLGQAFCAMGQPLLVNPTSEMAAEWFPPHERPTAAMIANLMNFVGSSLSFVLPPLVVKEVHMSLQETEQEIFGLLRWQLWISILSFFMTLFLYRPAPHRSAHRARSQMTCMSEALGIFRSKDFWLVNGFFTVYVSVCHAFDAVEGTILEHYGYSASLTSMTGISCAVASVLSTICEARCISSASAYRGALFVAAGFLVASQFLGYMCLEFQMAPSVFVFAVGVMGMSTPGWSCACELGSEVCFPARESTVSSILEAFGNLGGVFAIIYVQHLIDHGFGASVLVFLGIGMVGAASGLVCLSGRLKRTETEEQMELEEEEELQELQLQVDDPRELAAVPKENTKLAAGLRLVMVKLRPWRSILTWIAIGGFLAFCRVLLFLPQSQLPEDISLQPDSSFLDAWQPFGFDETLSTGESTTVPEPAIWGRDVDPLAEHTEASVVPVVGPVHRNQSNATHKPHPKFGAKDVPNFVINCRKKVKRMSRFRKHMQQNGLNVTVFPCVHANVSEVSQAIDEGLLGPGALVALEGTTRKGKPRGELLGKAISHLRLLKHIAGSNYTGVVNIFEDMEVVSAKFAAHRGELLKDLRKTQHGFDMVKLAAKMPGGLPIEFGGLGRAWSHRNVFKMTATLSPTVNGGLSDYVVTKQGAAKILRLVGGKFDTFGRWESLDQFLLSKLIKDLKKPKKHPFVGFTVQTRVLSFNCHPGRSGKQSAVEAKTCKTL